MKIPDRAVGFAVTARIWQLGSSVVTVLLIARYFSPELQGFYYTFASLLALQSFVELGFFNVIISVASHEWAKLGLDSSGSITGDRRARSRLISLGRLVFKWYAVAAIAFVVGVGSAGVVFFARTDVHTVAWQGPWIAIVCLTGLILWALPFVSLLEGCNQVETIQRLRLSQSILSSVGLWGAFALGAGLWALAVAAAVNALRHLWILLVQYRRFFIPFVSPPEGPTVHWRHDIWPMQWRLGLSGIVNYFAFSFFSPVMFYYHGPVQAGQTGMTLAGVYGIQSVAMAFLYPKVPTFGVLIARQEFAALDRLWRATSVTSVVVCALGALAFWTGVVILNGAEWPLSARLLSPAPTGLFLCGMLLMHVSACQTAYLRAHREEPIVALSVTSSLLIGLMVWLLGSRFGPLGAAAGYLGVAIIVVLWETRILSSCRDRWHRTQAHPPRRGIPSPTEVNE